MEENNTNKEIPNETKACRYCRQEIKSDAKVCHHCGKNQNRVLNILGHITLIMVLIAGYQCYLSFLQWQEAKEKNINAEEVLNEARAVYKKVDKESDKIRKQVNDVLTKSEKAVEDANAVLNESKSQSEIALKKAYQAEKEVDSVNKKLEKSNEHLSNTEIEFKKKFKDISIDIDTVKADLSSGVEVLNKKNAEASVLLAKLKSINDMQLLILRATNGDRESFNRLGKYSGQYEKLATDALLEIIRKYDIYHCKNLKPRVPWWKYKIDTNTATLEELIPIYENIHNYYKPGVLYFIWSNKSFNEFEKYDFIASKIQKTKRLDVLQWACYLMNKIADLNGIITADKDYLSWWEQNKDKYKQNKTK